MWQFPNTTWLNFVRFPVDEIYSIYFQTGMIKTDN